LIAMDAIENKERRESRMRDGMRSVEGGGEAAKRMSRTLELEAWGRCSLMYLNAPSKRELARRLSF
jgi:transcriptional regulator of acetoin/glycerol metabolism